MSDHNISNLVDLLKLRAANQPQKTVYIFLEDGEKEQARLTYQQLDQQAEAIASFISTKASPGDRALLLYPAGLDFIAAFFGCLYAGIIAVPAYPPRRNQSLERLQAIARDAEATLALSTQKVVADVERNWEQDPLSSNLHWLATDELLAVDQENFEVASPTPKTLAFLQYTSGSTGTPKGVMVSHGNIIHNSKVIYTCFDSSPEHVGVSWLPFHHDMGLIGGVLQTIYGGGTVVLMPPVAFLQKPIRWLQAIDRYRAVTSGGPNFAYELCVQSARPEQIAELDLSCWSLAFTGAEPVRPETLEKFLETFGVSGFSDRAFYPCYGMAETTLLVTGGYRSRSPVLHTVDRNALARNQAIPSSIASENKVLVGCGRSWFDQKVRIVDPDSLAGCDANQIGEIWVASDSVAQGYWQRETQTRETFCAHLADTGEGPFLRTGDLGFFNEEELFITGRLKDVVIIRGRNHYPQDIELTVETAHEALQIAGAAAFSIEVNSAEQLVVVQEVKRPYLRSLSDEAMVDEIVLAIRRAVSEAHELQIYSVQLLKPGSLPKTSSGKVQRKQCRASFLSGELGSVAKWQRELQTEIPTVDPQYSVELKGLNESERIQAVEAWLIHRIAQRLQISPGEIDRQEPLASYGLDSLQVIEMSNELEAWLRQPVFPTIVYDFPTVEALARELVVGEATSESQAAIATTRQIGSAEAIAVVGAGCRFPEAPTLQAFWKLLQAGQDAITAVPLSRWDASKVGAADRPQWGGFLKQIDQFDAKFFGISPREATNMDPQQRLLLEVCWETLENAGLSVDNLAGSQSGIFVGVSNGDYSRLQGSQINKDVYYGTGNAFSITANRLSYLFDWHGPSWAIDTACSSSLVAVHQACGSLRTGECDLALAGGVNLILDPQLTVTFSQAQMLAADGRCKTFDASADGYVRSEGCGMVALKRLSDAQRDGDSILGIIQGSAVNQDGRSNGLTAPNSLAQQSAIRQALVNAGISDGQVEYVEAHGTGTSLGDPIEVNALKAIFTEERPAERPCWLGSVKTNIGHLEPAAGIAGLIKVLLSLQQEEIPPHLHLQEINPYIQIEDSPLKIPTERQQWPSRGNPRIAGISGFGFGGTNAHIIVSDKELEQVGSDAYSTKDNGFKDREDALERPLHLLALSAKSESALDEMVRRYLDFLQANDGLKTEDVCFTANVGRSHFNHRLAIQSASIEQLEKRLRSLASGDKTIGAMKAQISPKKPPEVVFLFTGQGSQYVDMGRQLYESQPTFRCAIDECNNILKPILERSLLSVLYPQAESEEATALLNQTAYTQPALFAIEYALAQLWQSLGIAPDVVLGHSVGEYAAACVAGVFSLKDGLTLIAKRGQLMQSLPEGGQMLSVLASVEQVEEWIASYEQVAIAAINGPQSVVISGDGKEIEAIAKHLETQEIKHKKLTVSHAFHSPLMEPILHEFKRVAQSVNYSSPNVSFVSCLTGQIADGEIASADYWTNHIQQPVKFADGISTLQEKSHRLYVEIGPKPQLLGMAKQALPVEPQSQTRDLPSLRPGQEDWPQLLQSLSQLYTLGVAIDWAGFDKGYSRCKVLLPTYPFQRERYWSQADTRSERENKVGRSSWSSLQGTGQSHPLVGQQFCSPVPPIQFQSSLSAQHPAYLTHHRVFGYAILPAAAYLEMALSAGVTTSENRVSLILKDVAIQRGLIFSESQQNDTTSNEPPQTIQTILSETPEGDRQFQIFSLETTADSSKTASKPGWICHAKGIFGQTEEAIPAPIDLEAYKASFLRQIPIDAYYQALHQNGLEYGVDFQAIQQLWAAPNKALGKIALPKTVVEDPFADNSLYQIHPVLLDASFQILAAAVEEISGEETYLPAGIEKLRIYGSVPNSFWAIASVKVPEEKNAKQLVGHIQLVSDAGEAIADVEGLILNRTNRDVLLRYLQPATPPSLYKLLWINTPLTTSAVPALPEPAPLLPADSELSEVVDTPTWLIFSDGELGDRLVESLKVRGDRCIVLSLGDRYQQINDSQYKVNPTNDRDFQDLIEHLSAQSIQLSGILHLWSVAAKGKKAIETACASTLHLVQALTKARFIPPLWLITQGAQSVEGSAVRPYQSALWGLGRAIALEHPELNCRRIDLSSTDTDCLHQLMQEIDTPDKEDQIAYRRDNRYIARLGAYEDDDALSIPSGQSFQLKLKEYGLLDNLTLQSVPRREIASRDVEIQVAAAGLNFRDVLNALGLLKEYYAEHLGITEAMQLTFGFECAGTVVAVGEEVSHLQVGDEVMATMLTDGASRFVTTRSEFVIPKPKQMSFAEAATLPLAFLTAYYGLQHLAKLKASDKVLIHAAAGGVGQAAVQVAQRAGAEIFATASPGKWDFLKDQGIRHVMNSRRLDFADEVMALTDGAGVDVVLNSLNGDFIEKSFEVLAEGGRFVELGKIGIWDEQRVAKAHPTATYFPFDLGEVTRENPKIIRDLWVELSGRFDQSQFSALPVKTFSITQSIQAFRYMQQAKHIGKVVLTFPSEAKAVSIGDDGCYLITGGLGALGLKVAQWMVEQGGRHIVLVGRRSPSEAAREAIAQMEAKGAKVSVLLGDISQRSAVENILNQLTLSIEDHLPLKGVVHAAGVLEDGILSQLSWQQFSRVMAPKVDGAWHLHELTKDLPLDFFVCFSSITSLIGSPGQGNYAAANAFMDGLMQHRRALGLPGVSINWGPWADVGMAAQLGSTAQDRLKARGVNPIEPSLGLNILGDLLTQAMAQVGAFSIDWPKFTAKLPPGVELPVLERFQSVGSGREGYLQGLEALKKVPVGERRSHLVAHLQAEIADVLGYDSPDEIALDQPLADLGVDSLMAVELANQLEHNLGPTIPASFLFEHPTLEGLVDYLVEQMPSIDFSN